MGRKQTQETKNKLSEKLKGHIPWNKGMLGFQKGRIVSEETKRKIKLAMAPHYVKMRGSKLSEEIKRNMSLSRKGKTSWKKGLVNIISPEARLKMSLKRRKELNPNWQGGLSSVIHLLRESLKYRQWRSDIFTRDNFQCVIGGKEHGNKLHADHIKPFFLIIRENKIDSTEKGFECEELWNLNNGRTLCIECHKNTDTYGWKYKNFL